MRVRVRACASTARLPQSIPSRSAQTRCQSSARRARAVPAATAHGPQKPVNWHGISQLCGQHRGNAKAAAASSTAELRTEFVKLFAAPLTEKPTTPARFHCVRYLSTKS
eukprot:SAG11_NODE_2845_length_2913_cov_2.068230_4_plen_109_part_00